MTFRTAKNDCTFWAEYGDFTLGVDFWVWGELNKRTLHIGMTCEAGEDFTLRCDL